MRKEALVRVAHRSVKIVLVLQFAHLAPRIITNFAKDTATIFVEILFI